MPRPKVDSAVVHMVRRAAPPVPVKDEKMLFDLIRASFNERRKTLQNGIANYAGFSFSKAEALQAIEACGFKLAVRGEALTLSEFGKLADELCLIRESRKRVNEEAVSQVLPDQGGQETSE